MSKKPPTKWELGNSRYVSRHFNVGLKIEFKENSKTEREAKRETEHGLTKISKGENKRNSKGKIINKSVRDKFPD